MNDVDVLEVSIYVAAVPETVFPYFTDPVRYAQWMGTDVELDPVAGGVYSVSMREGLRTSGTFLEVDPPRRIVFTWGWQNQLDVPPGSTRVEVTLQQEGSGTRVTLRHHGLPTSTQVEHHRLGWDVYLGRLQQSVSGRAPGPDPNAT